MNQRMLDELFELLRIPSISSGGGDKKDLERAAEWLCDRIRAAGGTAEAVKTVGNPIVSGRLEASQPNAPTVMIYGHYDVQSPDPLEGWVSDPFEPEIRDDRVYARGAVDDKGNFYPLLYVACELAEKGELPVNVRVVVEGEEEIGSVHVPRWVEDDAEGADCVIVFDSGMLDEKTPAITLGVRGNFSVGLDVSVGESDLHSGVYGGSALNAIHVLHRILAEILPGPDGRLREELREGIVPPDPAEVEAWKKLPPGDDVITEVGGRPVDENAGRDYYPKNWADAAIEVNGIFGGAPDQVRTIVVAKAKAKVSMRLAPDQKADRMTEVVEQLLRAALPEGADLDVRFIGPSDPAVFDPNHPALKLAAQALENACGVAPALVRTGGSIGVLASWAKKGIPVILSGFGLPDNAMHAPNESFRLSGLEMGERSAREMYRLLADLPR